MPHSDRISLLLPTRQRPAELSRALESAFQTARQPDLVEVVLYVDDDDSSMNGFRVPGASITTIVGSRANMGAMTQACYERSRGEIVMLANDDVVFRTAGWDNDARGAIERFDDRIVLAWPDDGYSQLPAHPWLSREACTALGGLCPADYHREFIDTHLHDVFLRLRRLGHDRLAFVAQTLVEHRTYFAGKAPIDATYSKPWRQRDEILFFAWAEEREWTARRLARAIAKSTTRAARTAS